MHELVRAKVEQRVPRSRSPPKANPRLPSLPALKQSVEAKGRAMVRDAVRKADGKAATKEEARLSSRSRAGVRRTASV